jgi:hypothetical protein
MAPQAAALYQGTTGSLTPTPPTGQNKVRALAPERRREQGLQAPESRHTIKVALATGLSFIFSDALRSEGQTMVRRPAGSRRFGGGFLPGRNGVFRD